MKRRFATVGSLDCPANFELIEQQLSDLENRKSSEINLKDKCLSR